MSQSFTAEEEESRHVTSDVTFKVTFNVTVSCDLTFWCGAVGKYLERILPKGYDTQSFFKLSVSPQKYDDVITETTNPYIIF